MPWLIPSAEMPTGPGFRAAFGTHAFKRAHVVDAQLDKLWIKPKDVRYVVYSYLHLDHAGGMSYFPDAVHVVQRDEIRYALWPDPGPARSIARTTIKDIRKLNILKSRATSTYSTIGTLRLVKAPGHAPGHQVPDCRPAEPRRVCLAADTGHQRDGFETWCRCPGTGAPARCQ